MDRTALARLNERQRQCLRLFGANLEVKEIAAKLGLSPHTVNEHLRDARQILGVPRSIQAARLLAETERDNRPEAQPDNRIVSDPIGVAAPPSAVDQDVAPPPTVPVAEVPGNRNDLSPLERLGLIVAIAVGILALAGATIVGANAITSILREHTIDISDKPYRR